VKDFRFEILDWDLLGARDADENPAKKNLTAEIARLPKRSGGQAKSAE
jgi:hypothetical protein